MGGPIPFFVAFLVGIFIHAGFAFSRVFDGYLFFCGLIGGSVLFLWRKDWRLCAVWMCFVFGFWRFDMTIPRAEDERSLLSNEVVIEGVVGKKLSWWTVIDGRYAVRGLKYMSGNRVRVSCVLKRVPFSPGFDRRVWFARQGIWYECSPKEVVLVAVPKWWDPFPWLLKWRDWFSGRIRQRFAADQAELLIGMLYGSPSFSAEELDIFRRAGLMHLVAVSGSNISIVVTAVFFVLLRFGARRRSAFWATSFFVLTYCCFVGFSASVVRAALMSWLILFGRDRGRLVHGFVLLLVSASCMNLWNPWQLAFDPGFILSFLALIGLMGLATPLQRCLSFLPKRFGLREIIAMTFAATTFTAPYLAYAFGQWSFAGLLTNIFAVPLVPWVMASGACASVVDDVLVGKTCRLAASGFLDAIHWVALQSTKVPLLSGVIHFSFSLMVMTYVLLGIFVWRLRKTIHSAEEDLFIQK